MNYKLSNVLHYPDHSYLYEYGKWRAFLNRFLKIKYNIDEKFQKQNTVFKVKLQILNKFSASFLLYLIVQNQDTGRMPSSTGSWGSEYLAVILLYLCEKSNLQKEKRKGYWLGNNQCLF